MKEINRHLTDLDNRLTHISNHLQRLEDRQQAIALTLGWLLASQPDHDALRVLSRLANDFDENPDLVHFVELLDELRNHIMECQTFWKEQNPSRT